MKQVNQCFICDGQDEVIDSFGLARKAVLVSSTSFEFEYVSKVVKPLTLAEALKHPIAATTTHVSHEDSIFIYEGKCVLSLTAETFNKAGIEAKKQAGSEKYFAQIPLDDGPAHKRLLWAAENTLTGSYHFEVRGEKTPAIAKAGILNTPSFDCPQGEEAEQDWANTIQEWAGMVAIGSVLLEHNHGVERAISDYHMDGTSETLHVAEADGLFTPQDIRDIWEKGTLVLVSGSGRWPFAWGKPHVPSDNHTNPAYVLVRGDSKQIKALKIVPWQDLS